MPRVDGGGVSIPDPALVVLIGASGAGKSSWAASRYRRTEVVSSDALRAVVGSGEHDLAASADALRLLDDIVRGRVARGLTAVVDTLGMDPARRRSQLALARANRLPSVAVLFVTAASECRRRNRSRERPVPTAVLDAQLRRMSDVAAEVADEGWDVVVHVGDSSAGAAGAAGAAAAGGVVGRPAPRVGPASMATGLRRSDRLGFRLQISQFPWDQDPLGWLAEITSAARTAGFEGIALMDHLIQIPQVARTWDPIPEPWVTLGALAVLAPDLQLGTLVSPVTFRAPGVLAKTVATLSAITGGRAFCGVGAGWWDREHAAFGLPFPPAAERLDQLEGAIEMMRALWSAGTKSYSGRRISLPETTCYPRPVGEVPIIVGGSGERRTLAIAARWGDACNIASDLAVLERKIPVLHEHCRAAERDPAEVAVTVLDVPVVGSDREDVAGRVERERGRTSAAAYARRHHAGLAADHAQRYRALFDVGVSTVFVALPDLAGPDDVLRMAPVLAEFT